MKTLVRQSYQGRSGYFALAVFLLTYIATLVMVIAPDQVKSALTTSWPSMIE